MKKISKTDEQWQQELSPEEFRITRKKGTERAFTGTYWDNHEAGEYLCKCCKLLLFDAARKYDSGSGWPSFTEPMADDFIREESDATLGMKRTEVLCARCDSHLGHVFPDGPAANGLRYCINSAALDFAAVEGSGQDEDEEEEQDEEEE